MSHLKNKRIVLIGDQNSKRYTYFDKACKERDCPFVFMEYDNISLQAGDYVKIDPPQIKSNNLSDLTAFIDYYKKKLLELSSVHDVNFLNHPNEILLCLDKYECKKKLQHLPCTEMIDEVFSNAEELFRYLVENNLRQVFIKPRYGSGAGGIIALKYNHKNKQAVIYTTLVCKNMEYYNGTRIIRTMKMSEVIHSINFVLSLGAIVEKWLPKKKYKGLFYDLRVVMIKNHMVKIVPRGSKTPITNLHLNNLPLPSEIVENRKEIETLCRQVMLSFSGLCYAGIDILISTSGKLFIIEVNAQGDAIYQDFYQNNEIYTQQIDILKMNGENHGKSHGKNYG